MTPANALVSNRVHARNGVNEIEAFPSAPVSRDAAWSFDFRATAGFVPGSIEARSGEVLSADSHSIVLGLRPDSRTIRILYR